MASFFNRLRSVNQLPKGSNLSQTQLFIKGAFYGLLLLSLSFMVIGGLFFRNGISPYLQIPVYIIAGVLGFYLFRWVGSALHLVVKGIPTIAVSLILATLLTFHLADYMRFSWPGVLVQNSLIIAIFAMVLLAGSLMNLIRGTRNKGLYSLFVIIALVIIAYPVCLLMDEGSNPHPIDFEQTKAPLLSEMGINNPGEKGTYHFDYFTYGNGTDERRPEYAEEVKYKTETVDASLIIPEWKGKKAKWRERYWGFGMKEFPINGRTWMPKKKGKLPLVLIVHGNHGMEHYSDPGYAYLGELLASKGFITVSVDENFINGTWSGDFGGKEMPARAWLLLKHLSQWRAWNSDEDSDFFEKIDMDNIILMGHSRGGEAVSIAAAYNKLSHFPDNALVEFDFNFRIQGIVAIAPTDARYFRRLDLENINFLSIQGAYDADEASFFGLRQYQRISYTDSIHRIKAGLYANQANHGQFNSIWGRHDFGGTSSWFMNTAPLMTGEEQRQIAKTYIGAFTEYVFNQKTEYAPLFNNSATAKDWLPEVVYVNNFEASENQILVDYEEDIVVTTTKNNIATISAQNLDVWYEQDLKMRDNGLQGTNAAIIGWNNDSSTVEKSYTLSFNEPVSLDSTSTLLFSFARADDSKIKMEDNDELNFTIELFSQNGDMVSTTLSEHKKIAPKIKVKYMKFKAMNVSFGNNWELAMETFEIPFSEFSDLGNFEWSSLRLVFDQSSKGVIAVDNIGYRDK
ncbi:alpha/beta hydrolase [Roseivirga seohaensis]|uniref:hypothetical protein n=1 Tax=Roseivirga seohaensis TaxID=1914963 RepID=UPI000A4117BA|nr:hypothetical protein [Roseivirga seohaensis]